MFFHVRWYVFQRGLIHPPAVGHAHFLDTILFNDALVSGLIILVRDGANELELLSDLKVFARS